jgi:hypothetical protein
LLIIFVKYKGLRFAAHIVRKISLGQQIGRPDILSFIRIKVEMVNPVALIISGNLRLMVVGFVNRGLYELG